METMELNQESRPVCLLHRIHRTVTVLLAITCLPVTMIAVFAAEGQESSQASDVQSRGMTDVPIPTWPQKWVVNNREPSGFGFGVTQPGPVIVDVQSQGAPVIVELYGAAPQAVQRQTGSGTIRLSYQATPTDIQRSALWHVRILLAQAGGPPAQATGTIAVHYPPVDQSIVRIQFQARRAQKSVPNQESVARAWKEMDAAFQAYKTQFEQEKAARHAALEVKVQSQLNAALAQSKTTVQSRGLEAGGAVAEEAPIQTEGDVSSRALSPGTLSATKPLMQRPAPLAITSLSMTQGEPHDPIIINGTGFGAAQSGQIGELHFVVGPSLDLAATVYYSDWADTQIKTQIPFFQGIAAPVNGNIYVVRRSDGQRSPAVPFTFIPELAVANFQNPPTPIDSLVSYPDNTCVSKSAPPSPGWCNYLSYGWVVAVAEAGLFGYKGNDQFYMTKRLKNGWIVAAVAAYKLLNGTGDCDCVGTNHDVYVADSRIGTDLPYVNVRVWEQPFVDTMYTLGVVIKGPRGVPYE